MYTNSEFVQMLSETAVRLLSTLTYRIDAERRICWLPLNGIYWEDEWPEHSRLVRLPQDDYHRILRLFAIRVCLSRGETLNEDDQQLWDTARSQVPNWPLFQRVNFSADDWRCQDETIRTCEEILEVLLSDADLVSIRHHDGITTFSATSTLRKEHATGATIESWWRRIFCKRAVKKDQQNSWEHKV
jgi:hypothetical protein